MDRNYNEIQQEFPSVDTIRIHENNKAITVGDNGYSRFISDERSLNNMQKLTGIILNAVFAVLFGLCFPKRPALRVFSLAFLSVF